MEEAFFKIDWQALAGVLAFLIAVYFFWRWSRGFSEPYLTFSNLESLIVPNKGKTVFASWPRYLLWLSLLMFLCAFVDPRLLIERKDRPPHENDTGNQPPPTEGIAIYLLLDQSGSMGEDAAVGRKKISKIDLLKQVTNDFIFGNQALGLQGRPNDMIGLIAFARGANVLSPLTLDHEAIQKQLSKFHVVGVKDQDGTAIGYAIFKAANLIAATRHYAQELLEKGQPAYTIKNSVIILITDGLQDPNPLDEGKRLRNMDIPGAAEYAKEQGVRIYIVNVEPQMATEQFAANRHQMERSAELTGGKFFLVSQTTSLADIYQQIDQLEKSQLPSPHQSEINKDERPDLFKRVAFYPYLIAFGLASLFFALALETTVLKRIP